MGEEQKGYVRKNFAKYEFKVEPEDRDAHPNVRFKVLVETNFAANAYSVTLAGAIGDRPTQALCRYDVHDTIHFNNCRCCAGMPPQIWPGEFHIQRYNECCLNRGNLWHKCASLLPGLAADKAMKDQLRDLIGRFIEDMKLRFSDADTPRLFFNTGNP